MNLRRGELEGYVALNPGVDQPGANDIEYQSLVALVNAQDKVVSELRGALERWHLTAASADQGQAARFSLQDPPSLPTAPVPVGTVTRYGYPIAALGLGVFIAVAFIYIAYRADHAVRSTEDLEAINVRVLGRVPDLDSKRHQPWYRAVGRRSTRDFTRRLAAALAIRTG